MTATTEQPASTSEDVIVLADRVRNDFERVLTGRKRVASLVVEHVGGLRDRIRVLTGALEAAEAEVSRLNTASAAAFDVSRQREDELGAALASALDQNARLTAVLVDLLKSVQDSNGRQADFDSRIEAAILSAEIGLSSGNAVDISPEWLQAFEAEAFGNTLTTQS